VSIENRPYVGTWRLDSRELVQHTPDALVYVNGDTTLPGCPKCNGRIDIQKFITEVSVDAGTDPGSASASFTLSIPLHHTDSFARDAKFILTPGLEIHVYMRGYFPVRGMFRNLAEAPLAGELGVAGSTQANAAGANPSQFSAEKKGGVPGPGYTREALFGSRGISDLRAGGDIEPGQKPPHMTDKWVASTGVSREQLGDNLDKSAAVLNTLHQYLEQQGFTNVRIRVTGNGGLAARAPDSRVRHSSHNTGSAADVFVTSNGRPVNRTTVWASARKLQRTGHLPPGGVGMYLQKGQAPNSDPVWSDVPHIDHGNQRSWVWAGGEPVSREEKEAWESGLEGRISGPGGLPNPDSTVSPWSKHLGGGRSEEYRSQGIGVEVGTSGEPPLAHDIPVGDSLLDQYGLGGKGIENMLSYPYYHVFHGVVTQVSHAWSGGVNSVTVNAVSMLHFWQYHTISTNASVFGSRPTNSKLKTSMVGHNFTGMHPYQIMYTLHHDMVGAAGGVGWALSSKTNQSAASEVAGESLFSLNIRYWEQRFSQRMVKLRMHGASGTLFSAAQSTFLGRNSSDSLTQLVRHRFSDPSSRRGGAKGIMEDAISMGLFNLRKLEAMLFARSTNGNTGSKGKTKFELNLAEMQAFVSNIGNWGQPAFFESVYESKLDIAQKVMEVTGFEFYQDVDGDFVFKPPMYNLDTSTSRIYRIEDIDLISISTDEKEPQATYATVKGSHFGPIQGTGVENEWGAKGQYIDYRLVAQYGWRPVQYETAYFNDPKSMFFSAINRLDIMNAPSKAASVTIPVRAELRPGYPVYIPYLDAFYYCNSFGHSHSVGGQCTTSLQLVGKRAKFYAPGHPRKEGIDAIDLKNTILPARPLQVAGHDGHPRLAGFPNVVMALDPFAINPMFWVVGADIERLDDPVVLRNLLHMGSQKGIGVIRDDGKGRYTLTLPTKVGEDGEDKADTVEFYLSDDTRLPEKIKRQKSRRKGKPKSIPKTTVDIIAAGETYTSRKTAANEKIAGKVKEIVKLQRQLVAVTAQILRASDDAKKDKLRTKKALLDQSIAEVNKQVEATKAETEASFQEDKQDGVYQLSLLIKTIGERHFLSGGQDLRRIPETHSLLDMLSDKKAILSNGTQPGEYRYYSASHPDPSHQGQDVVAYSNPPDGEAPKIIRKNSFLDAEWQGTVVQGFLQTPTASIPGAERPEAELGDVRPTRGVRVLTSNPAKPNGEIVPTSQIRELMFAVQDVTQTKGTTDSSADDKPISLGDGPRWRFNQRFNIKSVGKTPKPEESIHDFFLGAWGSILGDITHSAVAADRKARDLDSTKTMPLPDSLPGFPESLPLRKGKVVPTDVAVGTYKLEGTDGVESLGGKWAKSSLGEFLNTMGTKLTSIMLRRIEEMRGNWRTRLKSVGGYSDVHIEQIMSEMNAALAARWRISVKGASTTRSENKSAIKRQVQSPVFPVSDARGYEVIGSYRYGRDVGIEPGGVWDSLHQQDPLQFLDRKTVEDIVDGIISGKRILVEREETVNGGKKIKVQVPLQGEKAVRDVEKRALNQLRRNLTDRQILDLGLAIPNSKDPNLLQLNLSNWFSDGNKEGVHKLPVNNAAFTLADLNDQQDGRVCSCKAAEADLLLDAFVDSEFLQFAAPGALLPQGYGTGAEDKATQFLTNQAMAKSVPWKQRQDALRGTAMERASSNVRTPFKDLRRDAAQGLAGEGQRQKQAVTNFNNAIEQANRAAQGITDEEDG
jgi:hypothetical protein